MWGWGLRTDRVYITLSDLHCRPLLIIIIIIIIIGVVIHSVRPLKNQLGCFILHVIVDVDDCPVCINDCR